MKVNVYSIRDTSIERSNLPFFARDDREAQVIIFRAGIPKSCYEDTKLFRVGVFDDETGIMDSYAPFELTLPPYPSDREVM